MTSSALLRRHNRLVPREESPCKPFLTSTRDSSRHFAEGGFRTTALSSKKNWIVSEGLWFYFTERIRYITVAATRMPAIHLSFHTWPMCRVFPLKRTREYGGTVVSRIKLTLPSALIRNQATLATWGCNLSQIRSEISLPAATTAKYPAVSSSDPASCSSSSPSPNPKPVLESLCPLCHGQFFDVTRATSTDWGKYFILGAVCWGCMCG